MTAGTGSDEGLTATRRGNSAKVILISLAVVFGVGIVACAGLALTAVWWFQRNFGEAYVTEPAAIRKMLGKMTDITLPEKFAPYSGSRLFGQTEILFRWCPEGNCPPAADWDDEQAIVDEEVLSGIGVLTFMADADDADPVRLDATESLDAEYTDEALADRYSSFTKTMHELTIRGRTCHFWVVKYSDESPDAEMESTTDDPNAAAETSSPDSPEPPSETLVWVEGTYPGKTAEVRLTYLETLDRFDEPTILAMLRSIR